MAIFCFGNNVLFLLLFYAKKNPVESVGVLLFSLRQLQKKVMTSYMSKKCYSLFALLST